MPREWMRIVLLVAGEIHGLGLVGIQRRRRGLAVHAVPED